jgi:methylated-DNA-[protein]-cysteine S-methyltransferase
MFHPATLSSPVGDLALAIDETGALSALAFADGPALDSLLGRSPVLSPDPARTAPVLAELRAYFAGETKTFTVPLAPAFGTPFQRRVWDALSRIPFGTTWSYKRLAAEVGGVARAVGQANRANPLCLVVPCHRVIAADGTLGGYSGGLDRKRWLLRHEGALLA